MRAPAALTPLLLLAGCASGEAVHGAADLHLFAPAGDGRLAAPGAVRSTGSPDPAGGAGLSLDLLQEGWLGSFRYDTIVLPGELDPAGSGGAALETVEAAAGPNLVRTSSFRLDAFAGARAWLLRVLDEGSLSPSEDREREAWVDPLVGIRASLALGKGVAFRVRGDSDLGNSGSRNAWRAGAVVVFDVSSSVSLSAGWETTSVHYDRHSGGDRVLCDLLLSGPYLGLELRF